MAYAVIRTGGKQYRVAAGDVVHVDTLAGNPGDKVKFDDVLLVGGDTLTIGKPTVSGAAVEAEIVQHGRGPKLIPGEHSCSQRERE